jgi:hypothetical protein
MNTLQADGKRATSSAARGRAKVLAVMQPYFFPYIGYYQLLTAVDHFVTLDDVTYIKQGWINRNRLLQQGQPSWFTLPVSGASSHRAIADVQVDGSRYAHWRGKFLKSVQQNYARAPCFRAAMDVVERVLPPCLPDARIAVVAKESLAAVMEYLGCSVPITSSTEVPNVRSVRGIERVLHICANFGITRYVNAPGGTALYDRQIFQESGIELGFLRSAESALAAGRSPDGDQLSMLHFLMHQPPGSLRELLQQRTIE